MTPFAQLTKAAGMNPLKALQMAGRGFRNMGRAANAATTHAPQRLSHMDFISRGAREGGEAVGTVGKQFRMAAEDARAAMGTARGSAERADLAGSIRYLRNGGIQHPMSKSTVSRFGVREPSMAAPMATQPWSPPAFAPGQVMTGNPNITGVSPLLNKMATPFAQLEKSAYRGRALAHGAVDAIDVIRKMLTNRGGGAVKAMHGIADKIPGKTVRDSVLDPKSWSEARWRAAGTGATAGAVGGAAGVGISKALRELGVYKNLGWEKDEKAAPNWTANVKPQHMRV